MTTQSRCGPDEQGAALVVALLFLLILTVLGTTGVTNNTLQEHMAGNTRNRDLAFQAAEHALAAADKWMTTQTIDTMRAFVDTVGVDLIANDGIRADGQDHANDATYWDGANWSSDVVVPANGNPGNVSTPPRYVVEKVPGYTDPGPPPVTYDYFRVTARGVGGTNDAVVVLQTLYRFHN